MSDTLLRHLWSAAALGLVVLRPFVLSLVARSSLGNTRSSCTVCTHQVCASPQTWLMRSLDGSSPPCFAKRDSQNPFHKEEFISFLSPLSSHPLDPKLQQRKSINTKEKHLTFCWRLSRGNLSPQGEKRATTNQKQGDRREKLPQPHICQCKTTVVPTPTSGIAHLPILLRALRNH